MRIQHNIMAMSAYRNYTNNVSAMKKNLEKLSSGYKINRAGDDAAGLAISEKMRAQITGLETAQKNVKDGISLVQTAEGALTEVHDMLNRMVELATQSANGTYDDTLDRKQMESELNQLRSEIDRIADSSNFNGIKLLDGSMDAESTAKADAIAAAEAAQADADAAAAAAPNATGEVVFNKESKLPIHTTMATNNKPSTTGAAETILETDYAPSGLPGFVVAFNGMSHTFSDPADNTNSGAGKYVSVKINDGTSDLEIKLSQEDIAAAYEEINGEAAKKGDTASAEVITKAAANYIETNGLIKSGGTATAGEVEMENGDKFTARADGDRLVFEIKGEPQSNDAKIPNFTVKYQGVTTAPVTAKGKVFDAGKFTVGSGTDADHKMTVTATINGEEVTFTTTAQNSTTTAANWATAIGNATAKIGGEDVKLSKFFTVSAETVGSDTNIIFEDTTPGAEGSGNSISGVTFSGTTANTTATLAKGSALDETDGYDKFTSGTKGYPNEGSTETIQVGDEKIDQLASTVVTLDNNKVVDGAAIRLGDETYVFAIGEDSAYRNVANAVYVNLDSADIGNDGKLTSTGLEKMVTKLAEVAKDNKTFTVSHRGTVGEVGLKQRQEVKDSTDMSTKDKLQSYIGITTVDEAKTAANTAAAVEEATANAAKLQEEADKLKEAAEKAVDGKSLSLQIGDTADSYNQLKVNIKDCHTAAMNIAGISVANQEDAAKAVDIIKDAINYVSDVRGTLGATQNRLDHTMNNLSVMTENIQDAESTIRDVDVAEEMMAYTKNNILIQSAQAMLAQANQVPQGVLQLLQ